MRFVVFCKRIFIVIKRRQQMISTDEGYMRLEYFSENVAADKKRKEFDIKNHALCYTNQKPDFLFIGDSITEYWELNAYFGSGNHFLVNRGIAGDTTKYLKKRFYTDAVQLRPRYCILGIGINDSIELEGDYWKRLEPTPYNQVVATAKLHITEIVQQAKDAVESFEKTGAWNKLDGKIQEKSKKEEQYLMNSDDFY